MTKLGGHQTEEAKKSGVKRKMSKCKFCGKETDGYFIYRKAFHGVCSDCHYKFGKHKLFTEIANKWNILDLTLKLIAV